MSKVDNEIIYNHIVNNNVVCSRCGSMDSKIIDKRQTDQSLRRRRMCKSCGQRFSTVEIICNNLNALKPRSS